LVSTLTESKAMLCTVGQSRGSEQRNDKRTVSTVDPIKVHFTVGEQEYLN